MDEIVGLLLFMLLIFVLLITGAYWGDAIACEKKAVSFERYDYSFFGGCMVEHNGRWLPLDNIRGFDDKG